jgi:hypothetical protein
MIKEKEPLKMEKVKAKLDFKLITNTMPEYMYS